MKKEKTMRLSTVILAGALALSSTPFALAQSDLVDGQVTKVDQSAGKISIKHGPIKKLDMEGGMTMVFKAQDPAMLKQVKAGDKIKFEADRVNGQITVTKIQKSK
jgi:Cu/Ag efflux protein CusF